MSALATVVAWVALAGWIGAAVLLVLTRRRLDALERAHTDRKWEIIALRAELGALRRRLRDAGADPDERGTGDADPGRASRPRRSGGIPDGATAWRRAHRRPGRPRRRRPL